MSVSKIAFILMSAPILFAGCDNLQQQPHTAVVDLNAVINATGQDEVLRQQIEQADTQLNSQLTKLAEDLNKQLADENARLGDTPTEEQQQQFNQLTIQANQQLQQAQQIAQQQSQRNRLLLGQQLRQKIKPIAERVAKDRGASVVIETTETLMWFDPQVDITDEVIAAFRATATQAGEPQAPEPAADADSGDTQQSQ